MSDLGEKCNDACESNPCFDGLGDSRGGYLLVANYDIA